MTSTQVTLPETPAVWQLGWLLARIADSDGLTTEELAAHVAPAFLEAVGAEQLKGMIQGMTAEIGAAAIARVDAGNPHTVVAQLTAADGGGLRIECHVEPTDPHRITGAQVVPVAAPAPGSEPVSWAALVAAEAPADRRSELSEELTAKIDELVATTRAELKLPGLAAAVADASGSLVYWHGLGTAHVAPYRPPAPDTVVRVGSITKTMTAIGAMQLVERGDVDLDAPVNDYLTAYKVECAEAGADPVTLRHLLTHSSGIMPQSKDIGVDGGQPIPSLEEFYAPVLQATKKPKEAWSYSNDAFATAGQLIADVTGEPFAAYMAENVFDRLGMANTSYLQDTRVTGELFTGYNTQFDEVTPVLFRDIIVAGAGSVFSTTLDMARYVEALMNHGANASGKVLGAASFDELFTPQDTASLGSDTMTMGLAFILTSIDDHRVVWHNGGWPGANSEMWLAPDDGLAVLAFTNTMAGGKLDEFANKLLGLVLAG